MTRIVIDVTAEDLAGAERKNSSRCAVAVALARTVPKATHIAVDIHGIKYTLGARRYSYLTPPKIHEYIVAFDAGDTLHPFRFTLRDDQRVVQQRRPRTDKGRELSAATDRVRRARRKADAVTASESTASEPERAIAQARLAMAEAQRTEVRARAALNPEPAQVLEDMAGVPKLERMAPRNRQAGVFRRNQRHYGARSMRVNSDAGPGDFHGPLDVDE